MTIFSNFCRNFCMCHLSALRLKIFRPTSTYDPKLNPQSIFQHNSKTSRRYVTSKLFISQGQYLMPPIWPGHKWFCKWINRRNRDVCSKSLFQLLTAWHWILKESFQPFFNGRALFRNFCIWITAKPYLDFFLYPVEKTLVLGVHLHPCGCPKPPKTEKRPFFKWPINQFLADFG